MTSDDTAPRNFELTEDIVKQTYLYLKNYAYYENYNFFLKKKIADFECDSFHQSIETLSSLLSNRNFPESSIFQEWLDSIDCYVLPKSISKHEDKDGNGGGGDQAKGLFISNITSSSGGCAIVSWYLRVESYSLKIKYS